MIYKRRNDVQRAAKHVKQRNGSERHGYGQFSFGDDDEAKGESCSGSEEATAHHMKELNVTAIGTRFHSKPNMMFPSITTLVSKR